MSYCRNCGAELVEGKRFCPECGEPTGESPVRAAAPTPSPESPVQKPKRKRKPLFGIAAADARTRRAAIAAQSRW